MVESSESREVVRTRNLKGEVAYVFVVRTRVPMRGRHAAELLAYQLFDGEVLSEPGINHEGKRIWHRVAVPDVLTEI